MVVIHDSAAELELLLDSIARHLEPPPQVVVVDAGSSDGGPRFARERGADLIELDANPGFGAATNAGVKHAESDVAVLVNPDVELLDGGLAALAERARAHDALLAPRLLNRDGSVQRSAHPPPGRAEALIRRSCTLLLREHCGCAPSHGGLTRGARSGGQSPPASPPARLRCDGWVRSIPPRSCSSRTSTCACAPVRWGSQPSCTPT